MTSQVCMHKVPKMKGLARFFGKCAEVGCERKATKRKKTRDGQKIPLCDKHYAEWV